MMGSCPRCSVQVPGWLYYEPPLVICLSCGAVIRDDTKANRYNDWDYKSGKPFKYQKHKITRARVRY
jgi:hypothetical protein